MLTSIGIVFIGGYLAGELVKRCHLPALLGMLLFGILAGPYCLNLLDASLLAISADLRQLALVIILLRAGLSLDLDDLKKVGRPAILMCFVPACFEIVGMVLIAPSLFGISVMEAAIMGAVVGAVSPAVIVPKMLTLMENGYGTDKAIPQMILAGASVDDVFVIVLFTAFTTLAQGNSVSLISFAQIPVSIVSGIVVGCVVGLLMAKLLNYVARQAAKILLVLGVSFLLLALETGLQAVLPMSGLLAIMSMGVFIQRQSSEEARKAAACLNECWAGAEIWLFVLVGAAVNIQYAAAAGLSAVLAIFFALAVRMVGVFVCLLKTPLTLRERFFCMIAYTPKATVQAAIGSMPLAMGLACGNIVLTVAGCAILLTAPLGAFFIELTYRKLLKHA